MKKRYLMIFMVFLTLVGCYFFMFRTPSNDELYNKYYLKIERNKDFKEIDTNTDLNVTVKEKLIDEKYHYVVTFTSNKKLNNFKCMIVSDNKELEYYPTFGIFDNQNINLVTSDSSNNNTKGINLVVSITKQIENFKAYVSYDDKEFYYLINVGV